MNTKNIIIIGLLYLFVQQPLNAQNMSNINIKQLNKNEVINLLHTKEPVLNDTLSDRLFAKVYTLNNGEILLVREDGKGGLWQSIEEFNRFQNPDNEKISIFNLENWLQKNSNLEVMTMEARKLLSDISGKNIDYSAQSLKAVSKIKIKDIVVQKDIFYAIVLYTCGYYVHHYGGRLAIGLRQDEVTYEPIVVGENNKTYTPYWEWMKNVGEHSSISLQESIGLEHIKYNLHKD